ncbi:uncharacterized protein LOC135681664 [Rhopilema esculentum]|uniref:uncharacterized protein LOC135681664 n=1 Tax=Rhopilema esculentum TaxID=499914 RepID=UPI0031D9D88D
MIAYKGRIGFKQYMPWQPIKYGMKVWLCANPQNSYVLNHEVYLGKEREGQYMYAVEKPAVVCLYNAYMIGVDLSDQLRTYNPLGRKGHRWCKHIFWFLSMFWLETQWFCQGHEFQPQETSQRRSGLKFRQSLAMQMIGGYYRRKSGTKKNIAYNRCDTETIREEAKYGHFICKIDGRRKECIQCKYANASTGKHRRKGRGRHHGNAAT